MKGSGCVLSGFAERETLPARPGCRPHRVRGGFAFLQDRDFVAWAGAAAEVLIHSQIESDRPAARIVIRYQRDSCRIADTNFTNWHE